MTVRRRSTSARAQVRSRPAPAPPSARGRVVMALACAALVLGGCGGAPARHKSPQASEHVAYGVEALERDDLDRAEAEFQLALEYERAMPQALNGLGLVAMRRGAREEARQRFREALRADPDFVEAHANLGALAFELGDPAAALPHLHAALDIDPGYVPARHTLARALHALGRAVEARDEYLRLTSVARESADAWAELAAVELALGRRDDAERAARHATELRPEHRLGRRVMANALRDRGEIRLALSIYEALLSDAPSDAEVLIDQGVALLLAGDRDGALAAVDKAVKAQPELAPAHFALGVVAVERGDDARAVEALGRAIELRARAGLPYPQAHLVRAGALARLGRKEEAAAAYDAFLREAAGNPALAAEVEKARRERARLGER